MDDLWNPEEANELLRAVLVEIEALAEQLSPARAEALLDEFEEDIGHAFVRGSKYRASARLPRGADDPWPPAARLIGS